MVYAQRAQRDDEAAASQIVLVNPKSSIA
ncbi:hypothetical protein A2U01_0046809 [Trifolium medium]|uniref:Uncharacterized protein n=1 Tax=Trifolium medium TaxID=97028 RepID=A0A392QN11_9FABA|nr:hypothetical protein [Trifolium medium]